MGHEAVDIQILPSVQHALLLWQRYGEDTVELGLEEERGSLSEIFGLESRRWSSSCFVSMPRSFPFFSLLHFPSFFIPSFEYRTSPTNSSLLTLDVRYHEMVNSL